VLLTRAAARRRLLLFGGVAPVLIATLLVPYASTTFGRLSDATYDLFARSAERRPPSSGVVIIDIDERSLSTVGQWPWRRDVIGRLISQVRDAGASVVALDVMFAESDRSQQDVAPASPSDVALAQMLQHGGVVLGYGLRFDPGSDPRPCVLHPIALALIRPPHDEGQDAFFRATGAVCNLPVLDRAAGRSGFLNAAPDSDGILRRVPLVAEFNGRFYPSLALASVMATRGVRDVALRIANVNAATLDLDGNRVPVDARSSLLLRYRGKKHTFRYVSAADVISGAVGADVLKGRVAFIGTTALGTREVVATPLDTLFAGVEVQATVADNLLQGDFVTRPPMSVSLEILSVLFVGVAIVLIVVRTGLLPGIVTAAAALAALWWGEAALLSARGFFVSPVMPTVGTLVSLAVMTLVTFTAEHARAETANRDKATTQSLMVQALLSLTETRDAETGRHSRRTQTYARLLAEQLSANPHFHSELTRERVELLSSLAPLHDIGKVGISDHVLNKPGPLTDDEQVEIRRHPVLGRDVLLNAEARVGVRDDATFALAKEIVYTHHERWDGTGYPQGLRGEEIPVAGRVMAVVDVYDAVHARSLYNRCQSHEDTVRLIERGRGTHFDPAVVDAFIRVADRFKAVSEEPLTEPASRTAENRPTALHG
jgi:HD-GYP domain-containing protein (c-di-GMP phosphodiesterase class II)/CHASE2 domain-containing sensor protein